MEAWSKDAFFKMIKNDMSTMRREFEGAIKFTAELLTENDDYFALIQEQIRDKIRNNRSGVLLPKTPKVSKKKNVKRIETIPENEVAMNDSDISTADRSSAEDQEDEESGAPRGKASLKASQSIRKQWTSRLTERNRLPSEEEDVPLRTSRRVASVKATHNIQKQQAQKLNEKLRRGDGESDGSRASTASNSRKQSQSVQKNYEDLSVRKPGRASRAKRTNSVAMSSDEEDSKRPAKKFSVVKQKSKEMIVPKIEPNDTYALPTNEDSGGRSMRSSRSKRAREEIEDTASSAKNSHEPASKKPNLVNETINNPDPDATIEPSMYEDAVGKSIPMNSTMNPNTTVTFDRKMMNVTVVLEAMQLPHRMNETVTLKKSTGSNHGSRRDTLVGEEPQINNVHKKSPLVANSVFQTKSALQDRMKELKESMANKEFTALLTDDESSPERADEAKARKLKKPAIKNIKQIRDSSLLSEDDDVVAATPPRKILREPNTQKATKSSYKTGALFSPWCKDSVKKRVEAFEQAGLNSPKSVDIDAPTRQTRTKTRAMAAAEAGEPDKSIVQKAAREASRKSLAKAKKVAQLKELREKEDKKENNISSSAQKSSRLLATAEKFALKRQERVTPVGKIRVPMPMSVNRIHHTPANSQLLIQKPATATKSNIVMTVDSFLTQTKTLTKASSTDNLAEKKRKLNDEDARRKKDEALKAKMEEKKRKREEKELKNKLAREANEKLDMEKRLKQEKEREEKARAAQLLHERQREEAERKRLLQLQRAQDKEERRKNEEQLRMQRLQEQEEAERQLAEQKRREQEAERRKMAEARAQHLAAAEAARMKAQLLAQAKAANEKNQPMNYKIDSEPDEDDSDDENAPRHAMPDWAQPANRKTQVRINQNIPMAVVHQFFGAKRCTPDLTQLFKGIKKERLQRTSSAIWKTPPRYSMMENDN